MHRGLQLGRLSADTQTSNFPPMVSEWIPPGDEGVSATIAKMTNLVHGERGVRSFRVRQATLEAVRGTERGMPEIDALFDWVKRNIEFRGEYEETLQSPEATINLGAGDCDDQATLLATMAKSLGYESRFKVIALNDSADEFSHVYVEVRDKQTGVWIALDPTVARAYPGWEADDVAREQSYGTISPGSTLMDTVIAVGLGIAAVYAFS
jgi:transglutaminase-like putative cysteine protease